MREAVKWREAVQRRKIYTALFAGARIYTALLVGSGIYATSFALQASNLPLYLRPRALNSTLRSHYARIGEDAQIKF